MKHLFQAWGEVSPRLKEARTLALFADFDGTITPIVERPEGAYLPPDIREALASLACSPRFKVVIISGRALEDLKARAGIPGLYLAGNHGLEIEGPGFRFTAPGAADFRTTVALLARKLAASLGQIPGVIIEDKGLTLSLHFRMVAEERVKDVSRLLGTLVGPFVKAGRIRTTSGKKVYEVRPPLDWDKGKAVSYLSGLWQGGEEKPFPIYLGDDRTDEDAFKVLKDGKGIGIFVGERPVATLASYNLASPQEVREFLGQLVELAKGEEQSA